MKKPIIRSAGYIVVRFPPPVPRDLGSGLRRELNRLLIGAGRWSASNTSALPYGEPGWCFHVCLQKPTATADWAERVAHFLRDKDIPSGTFLEVGKLYGQVEVDIYEMEGALTTLNRRLRSGEKASASLLLEIPGLVPALEALKDKITQSAFEYGVVTHAYQMPTAATIALRVQDTVHLGSCLMDIRRHLQSEAITQEVRLAITTRTHPQ